MAKKEDLLKYLIIGAVLIVLIGLLLLVRWKTGFIVMTGYAVYYNGPGEGQTTLMLQTAGSDNLGDAVVKGDLPNTNYGSDTSIEVKWGTPKRNSYMKFNISGIPNEQIIDNAELCMYLYDDQASQTIYAYHVYADWDESAITWNNQICGENIDNSTACNLTAESGLLNDGNQDNTWQCWNITNMIKTDYENKDNVSIALHTTDTGNADKFYSKEYADSSLRPYLNITYHLSDIVPPGLSIVYPINNANTTNNQIHVNYSVSDANLQACWYSNDSMSANTTLASCANITTVTWAEGQHNVTVWANDSVGNVNSSSVSFYVDSTAPAVNIILPQEGTTYGYNSSIVLGYSAYDLNLASCWYNVNYGNNITLTNCQNTTFNVAVNGNYILNVYANDSLGLVSSDLVNFNVQVGSPTIVLNSPIDSYLNNNSVIFSYTPSDIDLNYCELWGNFDGEFKLNQTDNSPVNGISNTFNFNLNDGTYLWNIKCFDDVGNSAFNGNKTFYIDTINPSISLTQPTGAKTSRTVSAIWSVSDTNLDDCWYNVYRGASVEIANTSVNCSLNTANFDVTVDADFVLNFYVNDSAGNSNNASSSFSVDTSTSVSPPSGESSGSGGGGGGGSSMVNVTQSGKLSVSLIGEVIARKGEKKTFSLNVKNIGKIFLNNCRLIAKGDISSWIYSTSINGIAPGQNVDFVFDLNVPEETTYEINSGSLEVKCEEASNIQNISVSIPKELGLIEIKDIKQEKDILNINYSFDSSKIIGENAVVEIWIVDRDGVEIKRIQDNFPINKEGLIERSLVIEVKGLAGIYDIYFALSDDLNNYIKQSVVLGKSGTTGLVILDSEKGKFGVYIVFLLILAVAVFFIWRRHGKEEPSKKKELLRKNEEIK